MQKIKSRFFILLIGLLLLFLGVAGYFITIAITPSKEYQQSVAMRYHLFCEVLKPGMSEDQALQALRQFGKLNIVEVYKQNPHALAVSFSDGQVGSLYGGPVTLYFFNHKYDSAYTPNFDTLETLCDFSQPTSVSP